MNHDSVFRHSAQEGLRVGPFLELLAVTGDDSGREPAAGPSSQEARPLTRRPPRTLARRPPDTRADKLSSTLARGPPRTRILLGLVESPGLSLAQARGNHPLVSAAASGVGDVAEQ